MGRAAAKPSAGRRNEDHRTSDFFEQTLTGYRDLTNKALLSLIPDTGPAYLYELIPTYPRRLGKGLRAALCFATCDALGGSPRQALNSAIAIELFHNAFLIHDDVQDESEQRRGGPTLHREHGVGIAVNVGNGTNLLALQRLMDNRYTLGPQLSWLIMQEAEQMLRHSLEGQAIELGWIRDNVCNLDENDYLHMCLKKTAWYSFIYPLRVGALIARGDTADAARFHRLGWYLGAAFQIQDDILNLTGKYARYGKEIRGDLWEGKRTLMLIHLLNNCLPQEHRALKRFLAKTRDQRDKTDILWVYELLKFYGSIEYARRAARQLAGAALLEALTTLRDAPESDSKQFILEMVLYVVRRDR
jgi:geranylgeranyl diphosphate synthase type II